MNIPPETAEWFSRLAELLTAATRLVEKGDFQNAALAFELLYELIEVMESGDELVFGDEIGSWMIPIREEVCIAAYLRAVAKTENAIGFTITAIDLLKRDKYSSFRLKVYSAAKAVASEEQMRTFEGKIKALGFKAAAI